MKIPRQKISSDRRHELLQVYLNLGHSPARELAIEYGVAPDYAPKLANELGLQPQRKFSGGGNLAKTVDHNSALWARARAIGPILV